MYKNILRIEIRENENGELFIDILDNDYNIIHDTIYNHELAKEIIDKVQKEVQ